VSEAIAHPPPVEGHVTWQKLILGDWTRIVRDPLDVARIAFVVSRFYDASVILVMFLLAWGSALSIYGSWGFYDNLVHFITPLLTTGMFYLLLVRLGVLPDFHDLKQLHHRIGFFLTVLALGMAIGAGWEVIEWTLDQFSDVGRVASADDTATDLISDTLGSAGSALILVLWSLGNHSMLRRPGAELASKNFFATRRT
jgi:hypothetical protein